MLNYNNVPCPVCKQPFSDSDDVVVCPHCGAPYHRECFKRTGSCVFQDKHKDGFIWENPNLQTQSDSKQKEESKSDTDGRTPFSVENAKSFFDYAEISLHLNLKNDSMEEDLDGIKLKEYKEFVGQSAAYYVPEFKKISEKKQSRFNFSAALFSGVWLIFRKCYLLGAILCIFFLLEMFLTLTVEKQIFVPLIQHLGLDTFSDIFNKHSTQAITDYVFKLPKTQIILFFTYPIAFFSKFALIVFMGIKGNKLYMNHCKKNINKIKSLSLPKKEHDQLIYSRGGVDFRLFFAALVLYLMARNVLSNMILSNSTSSMYGLF